jgi:hypothetical protein
MAGPARRALVLAACLAALAACAGFEPMEPPSNTDMKPGPGLFTGKAGAFVIAPAR